MMKMNAIYLADYAQQPEIEVLRPDGSWKPLAACVAQPEQFEQQLSSKAIEHFVERARESNLALDRVIAAIRNSWSG
jgi:hypothetical protein